MNKDNFIEKLRTALSGEVNYNIVNENIRYYEDYIEMEIKKGRPEQEVLSRLGDPRLIAKTIIETNKVSGSSSGEEAYSQEAAAGEERFERRGLKIPGWLWGIGVIFIVLFIISLLTSLVSAILPIIAPIIMIVVIVKIVQYFMR